MRHLALPLLIALPLLNAQAAPHAHDGHNHHAHDNLHQPVHGHDNLDAHTHGAANLDLVVEGNTVLVILKSPAANLVGFEHAPATAAERALVSQMQDRIQRPIGLLGLSPKADCRVQAVDLFSPLFNEPAPAQHGDHANVEASYALTCLGPGPLERLDLRGLFQAFPGIERISVRALLPDGQRAADLSADQPILRLIP